MPGLLLAVFIGFIGYGTKLFINSPLADPLLVALLFGILGRAALGDNKKFKPGYFFAPAIFLSASGSAICGASAIAVTSPAVEAEPNGKNHDI